MTQQSGGSGVANASSYVLIKETILAAPASVFSFTAIPQTYRHLRLVLVGRGDAASLTTAVNLTLNGDSSALYDRETLQAQDAGVSSTGPQLQTSWTPGFLAAGTTLANTPGLIIVDVPYYAQTGFFHSLLGREFYKYGAISPAGGVNTIHTSGQWESTAAITSMQLAIASGNYVVPSACSLFGIG